MSMSLHLCSRSKPTLRLHALGFDSKFLGKRFTVAQIALCAHPLSNKLWPAREFVK
jgi:hypothetical protein